MDRGRPGFPRDCSCPVVLEHTAPAPTPPHTGLSPALVRRSRRFYGDAGARRWSSRTTGRAHNPRSATPASLTRITFGQPPGSLATTTGGVLLPPGTEMFQFPRFPPTRRRGSHARACGVAPFGDGGLGAWLPLPHPIAADRRPSSARRAEASSDRASCLAWSLVSSTTILDYSL